MKSFFVFLLLFITLAGTFVPCCQQDQCCENENAQNSTKENSSAAGICSPFFACGTCHGFVDLNKSLQLAIPVIEKQVFHESVEIPSTSTFLAFNWQPPRIC